MLFLACELLLDLTWRLVVRTAAVLGLETEPLTALEEGAGSGALAGRAAAVLGVLARAALAGALALEAALVLPALGGHHAVRAAAEPVAHQIFITAKILFKKTLIILV